MLRPFCGWHTLYAKAPPWGYMAGLETTGNLPRLRRSSRWKPQSILPRDFRQEASKRVRPLPELMRGHKIARNACPATSGHTGIEGERPEGQSPKPSGGAAQKTLRGGCLKAEGQKPRGPQYAEPINRKALRSKDKTSPISGRRKGLQVCSAEPKRIK